MDSHSNYENKKKMLFDCLTTAEACIKGTSLEQTDQPPSISARKPSTKPVSKFQGKESIFKRPDIPIRKCLRPRRMPDFQANPHKWKKYTLDDADISENANTSAAFAFLQEIERRKDGEEEKYGDDEAMDVSEGSRIIFSRKTAATNRQPIFRKSAGLRHQIRKHNEDDNADDEKTVFRGSKMVMPEYVIGQKTTKAKKPVSIASEASGSRRTETTTKQNLHLQHLFDAEETEED